MAKLEKYAAPSVFNPPAYAQAVKITGASTVIVLSGQVDYAPDGSVGNPRNFKAQAVAAFKNVQAQISTSMSRTCAMSATTAQPAWKFLGICKSPARW